MVIKNPNASEYLAPLKKLLPQGAYWEKLLEDEDSDIALICKARTHELAQFRSRMNALQKESFPNDASETLGDWERVYFGHENDGLGLEQRRTLLCVQKAGGINIAILRTIAEAYGGSISKVAIPYAPAAFGYAQFGLSCMASIAGMWVVLIHCSVREDERNNFEAAIANALLANQTVFFIYGE